MIYPYLNLVAALLAATAIAASGKDELANPDFTKGGSIPAGSNFDLTLGSTGLRGWMYANRLSTAEARQVAVTKVDEGSPADGVFEVGDVILGTFGKPFSTDPRVELGNALTLAESTRGGGALKLTRWRDGKTEEVDLKLKVLGDYSATAPYDCPKSKHIFEQGCMALAARMLEPDYGKQSSITRSLNALALLASGDPEYLSLVKREAEWAAGFKADRMATWYYGYVLIFLAEYHLITGDESIAPGLHRIALEAAKGQSIVGSWGHKFAGEDGRLVGYGMMNAPGLPLTMGLLMAHMGGFEDTAVTEAISRSLKMQRFYIGKGAPPYGDHAPWMSHEDNGKSSMAAVLFNLQGNQEGAEFFSRMGLAAHNNERDAGHTGNFWNMAWAMPGVAIGGPNATGAWMKEFGTWKYDLARRWDGTFTHQSPPAVKGDYTRNWDATGAYLLAYAMPRKILLLTGRKPSVAPQLTADEAASIIEDGQWPNPNGLGHYVKMTDEELLERLGSWSPAVRNRAGHALSQRENPPLRKVIALLESPDRKTQLGACQMIGRMGGKAEDAVKPLRKLLQSDDYWVRVNAAEALCQIGEPAMEALPEMLQMIARKPDPADPRAMEQRFISVAVFQVLLKKAKSIEGIDKPLLYKAIVAGLGNDDGRSRGAVADFYSALTYEEIKPLLPAIYGAIVSPSPSGIMFSDSSRLKGLHILADHHIREGMELCISTIEIGRWNLHQRMKECPAALAKYGASAAEILPQILAFEKELANHPSLAKSDTMKKGLEDIRAIISTIEKGEPTVKLRSLKD